MKNGIMRKMAAIVLAMAMVLSSGAIGGLAETTNEPVYAFNEELEPMTVDVEVTEMNAGVNSYSGENFEQHAEVKDASATVTGDVTVSNAGRVEGVTAEASDGGYAETTVTGDVVVKADVMQDPESGWEGSEAVGVSARGIGDGSEAVVTVNGNVTAVGSSEPAENQPLEQVADSGAEGGDGEGGDG